MGGDVENFLICRNAVLELTNIAVSIKFALRYALNDIMIWLIG